jgi:hypothetical protein
MEGAPQRGKFREWLHGGESGQDRMLKGEFGPWDREPHPPDSTVSKEYAAMSKVPSQALPCFSRNDGDEPVGAVPARRAWLWRL